MFHVEEFDFRIRGNCERFKLGSDTMILCLCKTLIAGRDQGGERAEEEEGVNHVREEDVMVWTRMDIVAIKGSGSI